MAHAALMRQLRAHVQLRRDELQAATMEEYDVLINEERQLHRDTLRFSQARVAQSIEQERRRIVSGELNRMSSKRAERRRIKDLRESRLRAIRQQGQELPRQDYSAPVDCWQQPRKHPMKRKAKKSPHNASAAPARSLQTSTYSAFNSTLAHPKLAPAALARRAAPRSFNWGSARIEAFPATKTTALWCRNMGFDLDPHLTLPGAATRRKRPQTAPLGGSFASNRTSSLRRGGGSRRGTASSTLDFDSVSVASIPDLHADDEAPPLPA